MLLIFALGAAIGAFHGCGVTRRGLPPFIMTLTALTGIGLPITNGASISGLPDAFANFSFQVCSWVCRRCCGW